jgi:hypothetical protein
MTSSDLYAIYVDAYAESSHFEGGRLPGQPAGLSLRLRRMLSVERTLHTGRRALAGLDFAASGT